MIHDTVNRQIVGIIIADVDVLLRVLHSRSVQYYSPYWLIRHHTIIQAPNHSTIYYDLSQETCNVTGIMCTSTTARTASK